MTLRNNVDEIFSKMRDIHSRGNITFPVILVYSFIKKIGINLLK